MRNNVRREALYGIEECMIRLDYNYDTEKLQERILMSNSKRGEKKKK